MYNIYIYIAINQRSLRILNNIIKLENGDFEVQELSKSSTIIWSKDHCGYCTMAKDLLSKSGVEFEVRNISENVWTIEQLQELAPGTRSFPQIFMDGNHIGGFDDLDAYLLLKEEEEQKSN